ncbi:hypothetical protein HK103_006680 [Boothiomyces macroporosus]|uniref:HNH nuclease domain-containing protein n=1 Tax=Boothiomyces macroporosus TaxID=261099 RepID=A0AAD5Y2E0_9FUNG|nr:hypothetical protein HK103_006680 [Boothiomyces macroporosus]
MTTIEVATASLLHVTNALKLAEDDYRKFTASHPNDLTSPQYLRLLKEQDDCRKMLKDAQLTLLEITKLEITRQQTMIELKKQETARLIAERELLLQRSPAITKFPLAPPSMHPSEYSLTPSERATLKENRRIEKNRRSDDYRQFKAETILYYYGKHKENTIRDMLTNIEFPTQVIHRSHIYQASWNDQKFIQLVENIPDITKDSPQNMLLLHDHVEEKYDSGQLLIEFDEDTEEFVCHILDQSIAKELIFVEPEAITFEEYDGKPLHFPTETRPLKRLIRFRAIVNRMVAIDRGYIQPHEYQHLMDEETAERALIDSVLSWHSKIPDDSHLYVNTPYIPE